MHYLHTLYIYFYTTLPGVSRKDYVYIIELTFIGCVGFLYRLPVSFRSTPQLYYMFTVNHKTLLSPVYLSSLCIKAVTLQYWGRVV